MRLKAPFGPQNFLVLKLVDFTSKRVEDKNVKPKHILCVRNIKSNE